MVLWGVSRSKVVHHEINGLLLFRKLQSETINWFSMHECYVYSQNESNHIFTRKNNKRADFPAPPKSHTLRGKFIHENIIWLEQGKLALYGKCMLCSKTQQHICMRINSSMILSRMDILWLNYAIAVCQQICCWGQNDVILCRPKYALF